jgi:deoxycytidylate deaminase
MKTSPRTVDIRGKLYETVASRVDRFREEHADWTIETSIVTLDADQVVMRAAILDPTGRLISTGHSQEFRASSQINKTSALENAETSAIGRALAAFGIGGTEFATANEVLNAMHQQGRSHSPVQAAVGDWGNEHPDQAQVLRELAAELVDLVEAKNEPRLAYLRLLDQNLDGDQKLFLWGVLAPNSRTRAALKVEGQKAA